MTDRIDRIADDITDLKVSMATLVEKLTDYPDLKKDVESLKTFKQRVYTVLGYSAAGSSVGGVGWLSGFFEILFKGQSGTH